MICSECGSKNVQIRAWVDANTQEFINDSSDGDNNDNWCADCEEHVALEEVIAAPVAG